jgi:hypothetical protein
VRAANHTVPDGEDIDVAARFKKVRKIWSNASRLPEELSKLLKDHETLVRGGDQISRNGRSLIKNIQKYAALAAQEFELGGTAITDPLSILMDLIAEERDNEEPPIPIEKIPPERVEIRRREIAKRRRLVAVRGPSAAKFRRNVREAYRATCVVCGLRLPKIWHDGRPGVDSAHILPWGEFDLDSVSNGLCLCKTHHWAFDEGLIEIRFVDSKYFVHIPAEASERAQKENIDIGFLQEHEGQISKERLPKSAANRPRAEFLQRLHESLYP